MYRGCSIYQAVRRTKNILTKPILCENKPWLGIGYYFWECNVDDAHFWGKTHYKNNYEIYYSSYTNTEECLDLIGNYKHKDYLIRCSNELNKRGYSNLSVGSIIEILKKVDKNFNYKAIRACPIDSQKVYINNCLHFDNPRYILPNTSKWQICIIELDFLTSPYQKYTEVV